MKCRNCGQELMPDQLYCCPICGTNNSSASTVQPQKTNNNQQNQSNFQQGNYSQNGYTPNGQNQNNRQSYNPSGEQDAVQSDRPMKWYKFLINFMLFASAGINIFLAIYYGMGMHYGKDASLVYNYFSFMKGLDIFMAVICAGVAVMAIVTRFALAKYKKIGPKLIIALYIVVGSATLLYALLGTLLSKINLFGATVIANLVVNVIMVVVNFVYFRNRAEMFNN